MLLELISLGTVAPKIMAQLESLFSSMPVIPVNWTLTLGIFTVFSTLFMSRPRRTSQEGHETLFDTFEGTLKRMQEHIGQQFESLGHSGQYKVSENIGANKYSRTFYLEGSDVFQRSVIVFSKISDTMSLANLRVANPEVAKTIPVKDSYRFHVLTISSVSHPISPYLPTIHFNYRIFYLPDENRCWFAGGTDISPTFVEENDYVVERFFNAYKEVLVPQFGHSCYEEFRNGAEKYFQLPHRDSENRGAGGFFFEDLPVDPSVINFTRKALELVPLLYKEFLNDRDSWELSARDVEFQQFRGGRYTEYNLLTDRGTKFGINQIKESWKRSPSPEEAKRLLARAETMLATLPTMVRFPFRWETTPKEKTAMSFFKRDHSGPEVKLYWPGTLELSDDHPIRNPFYELLSNMQTKIFERIQEIDPTASCTAEDYQKSYGGGRLRILEGGKVFEKGVINLNVSRFMGSAQMNYPEGSEFTAVGLSCVLHPLHPRAPTLHFNYRFISLNSGEFWFGGGTDLTPHLVNLESARAFHQLLRKRCQSASLDYEELKKECDQYFVNVHRNNERRGVGGIFFDRLVPPDIHVFFDFVQCQLEDVISWYLPEVTLLSKPNFTEREREWQLLRRGRYVEFNLLYDRGTLFGLDVNKRGGLSSPIDAIMGSLPPMCKFSPLIPQTDEEVLSQAVFLNPRDW